jgi:hypothetical protein
MKVLLDLSPAQIADRAERFHEDFWQLRTPLTRNALAGCPYALDNGCFSGKLPKAWGRMLDEAHEVRPLWVTLPDVVGDARRTLELFARFEDRAQGLPKALVLQDGIGNLPIPWDRISAVFIGGSDEFKVSREAKAAATAARMLGKLVHVGRVNTAARVRDWLGLADSIDGSGISRYDHMLADVLAAISGKSPQSSLF